MVGAALHERNKQQREFQQVLGSMNGLFRGGAAARQGATGTHVEVQAAEAEGVGISASLLPLLLQKRNSGDLNAITSQSRRGGLFGGN